MKIIGLLLAGVEGLKEKIDDYFFKNQHKKEQKNFTRRRKIGFKEALLIMINFKTKSNALSTYNFMTDIINDEPVTRQSYEKARDKMKSSALKELFEDTVKLALSVEDPKLFNGYRVSAIDGTVVLLPKAEALKQAYGSSTPANRKTFARISLCLDVLNGTILDGEIAAYEVGERKLAMKHVEKDLSPGLLYLFDRGYWSPELVAAICDRKQKFLMRLSSNAVAQVANSEETNGDFIVKFNSKDYSLRFFKFELESGEMEYLATNLSREEVADEQLSFLYHLRWGIETKYNELKNRLQFEGFSGKNVNAIEQDFYASMLVMNFVGFAIAEADGIVKEERANKNNKHEYKPNGNMATGILKDRLIKAVIEDDPEAQANMIDSLVRDISRFVIPIKPNRHVPRTKLQGKMRKTRKPKNPL